MIGHRYFVGLKYLRRNTSQDEPIPNMIAFDAEIDTLSLRVGMKF